MAVSQTLLIWLLFMVLELLEVLGVFQVEVEGGGADVVPVSPTGSFQYKISNLLANPSQLSNAFIV